MILRLEYGTDPAIACPMADRDSIRYNHRSWAHVRSFLPGLGCYDRLAAQAARHGRIRIQTCVSTYLAMR